MLFSIHLISPRRHGSSFINFPATVAANAAAYAAGSALAFVALRALGTPGMGHVPARVGVVFIGIATAGTMTAARSMYRIGKAMTVKSVITAGVIASVWSMYKLGEVIDRS